jgi:hypothetical protein
VESRPDVDVRGIDGPGQGGSINVATRPELHVAAALAGSLEQAGRVLQQRTKKEADVDVILERVDVGEPGVADAGGRTAIVHQFADVIALLPHAHEPLFGDLPQPIALRTEPDIDRRVACDRRRKAKYVVHRPFIARFS